MFGDLCFCDIENMIVYDVRHYYRNIYIILNKLSETDYTKLFMHLKPSLLNDA